MTTYVRMMAIASGTNPVAPGSIITVDSVSARTAPNYCQIELTGTSVQRPAAGQPGIPNLPAGTAFYDTTLAKTIYFDGASWRDPTSGATV